MAASFCRKRILHYKNCLSHIQRRTGYVVLIPETPDDVSDLSVISTENLPDFEKINVKTCNQIFTKLSQQYEVGAWELQDHLEKNNAINVFKHILEPLELLSVPFFSSWGILRTLYFSNSRNMSHYAFNSLSEQVLHIRNQKFHVKSIYIACQKQLENERNINSEEEKRILKKFVWEGVLNGLNLEGHKKEEMAKCITSLHENKKKYEEKLYQAKTVFKQIITDEKFAEDCPLDLLRCTSMNSNPEKGPWVITLNRAIFSRYMEYCSSRDARFHIWMSFNQLASPRGDSKFNAIQHVEKIRSIRHNIANILGYSSYAHLSMQTKMAGSVENVQSVLSELLEPAKYAQEREIYELEKFAYNNNFRGNLELWDIPYWKRNFLRFMYNINENELKEYFPLSQVLLGLIALCEQVFGIIIEEEPKVEGWDSDVKYFRICDEKTKNIIGGFYLDPFARKDKIQGELDNGWFITIRPRSRVANSLPLSSLIFNFNPPNDDTPTLLYWKDIENLFDKFGQMLQYTLTEMSYSDVSGMSNIEWDAIGLSRYFMKYWLTEKGTLESISGHYDTGESLPATTLDNLSKMHKLLAGTELCRKIYLSNLDLNLHLRQEETMKIANELWPKHLLFQLTSLDYHPLGFEDIISGPWGGSFYGDLWSQMLAADVFSAFEEVGFSNQEEISQLGKRFRSTFLALGGGADSKEVFRRFRSRDPDPKFLTKFLGLKDPVYAPKLEPEPVLA